MSLLTKNQISPAYQSWRAMIYRCSNPGSPAYKYYGGRGIKVCKRWLKFENFLEDMGERPEGKTLDRFPDNDGDYKLKNCRWATKQEQSLNSRQVTEATGVTWDGRRKIRNWAARIRLYGRSVSLGYFETKAEASQAYKKAKTLREIKA